MNHQTELAFKAWLLAESIAIPIFTGFTHEEIPSDIQCINCFAGDSEHVVGPLNKVNVTVVLSTPPHSDEDDDATLALAAHKDVLTTLRTLVTGFRDDDSQLETVFNSTTSHTFAGGKFEGENEALDDGKWVTTLNLMIGVR